MKGVLISAKSLQPDKNASLGLEAADKIQSYPLKPNQLITIEVINPEEKFCCGWYDISTHTNHPCPNHSKVDTKYDSCYVCRNKTNFNPAFYNSSQISDQQKAYNLSPHSVYIAYFGNGLAKAGIMADSRGLTRLYEQGAIFFVLVGNYPDAYKARQEEEKLIKQSLTESIRKKQKEEVLAKPFTSEEELKRFKSVLKQLNIDTQNVTSNLELFSYKNIPLPSVKTLPPKQPISGTVRAIVGKYLILENNERAYGVWLDSLYGREIRITNSLQLIEPEPEQAALL